MITGNEPAYPITNALTADGFEKARGLTIRQHFAAMAMQGIVQSFELDFESTDIKGGFYSTVAEQSVKMADALLNELNKKGEL